jgi:hypothetical protein
MLSLFVRANFADFPPKPSGHCTESSCKTKVTSKKKKIFSSRFLRNFGYQSRKFSKTPMDLQVGKKFLVFLRFDLNLPPLLRPLPAVPVQFVQFNQKNHQHQRWQRFWPTPLLAFIVIIHMLLADTITGLEFCSMIINIKYSFFFILTWISTVIVYCSLLLSKIIRMYHIFFRLPHRVFFCFMMFYFFVNRTHVYGQKTCVMEIC